jgi:hypothetical protein
MDITRFTLHGHLGSAKRFRQPLVALQREGFSNSTSKVEMIMRCKNVGSPDKIHPVEAASRAKRHVSAEDLTPVGSVYK